MGEAADSVLAVGFFDGVHLGHRAILDGAGAALTFRNHPLSVLAPGRAPPLIMGVEERLEAIRACGVGEVVVLDFTPELAALEPGEFLRLMEARRPFGRVRCGANWRFGRGGAGDAGWLREHGRAVEVVPYAMHGGEPVSSSRIRACLGRGAVEEANAMLGRKVGVSVRRFGGKGVGRRLGWPTVNFASDAPVLGLLPRGVYVVEVDGLRGVANYGVAPTMGDKAWPEPVLEVHFPGGEPPAESPSARVSFARFLRPERRFASVADLQAQIAADCAAANGLNMV